MLHCSNLPQCPKRALEPFPQKSAACRRPPGPKGEPWGPGPCPLVPGPGPWSTGPPMGLGHWSPHWALPTGPEPWSTGPALGLATGPPMGLATGAPLGPGLSRAKYWLGNSRNPTGSMMKPRSKFLSSPLQDVELLVAMLWKVCRPAPWLAP